MPFLMFSGKHCSVKSIIEWVCGNPTGNGLVKEITPKIVLGILAHHVHYKQQQQNIWFSAPLHFQRGVLKPQQCC